MKQLLVLTSLLTLLTMGCNRSSEPQSKDKKETARIAINEDVTTFDPRKARSLPAINVLHNMYEGLVRVDEQGQIEPALAEKYEISRDQKSYTFTIRDCSWSNGNPITAYDFEKSLKAQLEKNSSFSNAYQLYVIQNAKAASDGKVKTDAVGITALDNKTLQITLEYPASCFLQMLATHPFFAVPKKYAESSFSAKDTIVSSGPFVIESYKPQFEVVLKKNQNYWDKDNVVLERIQYQIVDDVTSLHLFEKGQLDWAGSPAGTIPPDAISNLRQKNMLCVTPAAGVSFIRVNVEAGPLSNKHLRQALACSISRSQIVEHLLHSSQEVATSFVPPCMGLKKQDYLPLDIESKAANKLMKKALQEMNMQKIPELTLTYATSERAQKMAQALQQNFKNTLGIQVTLQPQESKAFYEKITKKDYQLALGSWFADYFDPMSFLSVFHYKNNGTNNTQWEDSGYAKLLYTASKEQHAQRRQKLYEQAQSILMDELPIIPLFYFNFNYLQKQTLQDSMLIATGYVDLKDAEIVNEALLADSHDHDDNDEDDEEDDDDDDRDDD